MVLKIIWYFSQFKDIFKVAGVCSGNYIYLWKSKGLSDERINSITTSNYSITPELSKMVLKQE